MKLKGLTELHNYIHNKIYLEVLYPYETKELFWYYNSKNNINIQIVLIIEKNRFELDFKYENETLLITTIENSADFTWTSATEENIKNTIFNLIKHKIYYMEGMIDTYNKSIDKLNEYLNKDE